MFCAIQTFLNQKKVAFLDDEKQPFAFFIVRQEDVNFGDIYTGRITQKRPLQRGYFIDIGQGRTVYASTKETYTVGQYVTVSITNESRPGKDPTGQITETGANKIGLIQKGPAPEETYKAPIMPWTEDLDDAMEEALQKEVFLADGARLIIERTAAFGSIDVDSNTSTLSFQEINTRAVPVIAREIMKRNIGGNIVIDFIGRKKFTDMKPLALALQNAFANDYTETTVAGVSPLGHVEVRRTRQRSSLEETMTSLSARAYRLFDELIRIHTPIVTLYASPVLMQALQGTLAETFQTVQQKRGAPIALKTTFAAEFYRIEEGK